MLTESQRLCVKATAPLLAENGLDLTRHFYSRLFTHHPELREIFNQGNQQSGAQQMALATAVTAYARHIDNPTVLRTTLERIAEKHVSLGVSEAQYAVVGTHLLASISEVLGAAATPTLLQAWEAAYAELATLLAGMETLRYQQAARQSGGWTGWRTFRVQKKVAESSEVTSFELTATDNRPLPDFQPGQYISVRVVVPKLGLRQARQYSLSAAPGKNFLRISVKREVATAHKPPGSMSNLLHDSVAVGDSLDIAAPCGTFYLHQNRDTPVVLISAGVGITPMIAMLEHLANTAPHRCVRFIHAARNPAVQAFGTWIHELAKKFSNIKLWIVHSQPGEGAHATGRLALDDRLASSLLPAHADYYICGPHGFMQVQIQALAQRGVDATRIHSEAFSPSAPPPTAPKESQLMHAL